MSTIDTTARSALKLALDALDEFCELGAIIRPLEVRDYLRKALASEAKEQPAQQEPVACKHEWFRTGAMEDGQCRCINCGTWNTITPAQQVTDGQVEAALKAACMHSTPESRKDMRRAIEAAHGIKENA